MKLFILLILVFLLFLTNSNAICCSTGCFPTANKCCNDPSVGYIGCYNVNILDYVCPGNMIGECLKCTTPSPEIEGTWTEALNPIIGCNSCEITYDSDGLPINSKCSSKCGEGMTKCSDGTCKAICAINNCNLNGICEGEFPENEGCACKDCYEESMSSPSKTCISKMYCCNQERDGSMVCSGDKDNDKICNYDDYCIHSFDKTFTSHSDSVLNDQVDADKDCFVGTLGVCNWIESLDPANPCKRSKMYGYCGDDCDVENLCFDQLYGNKQCCDDPSLLGTSGSGTFYGFTSDCPKNFATSFGCWSLCSRIDIADGKTITYKVGPCIDGLKLIIELKDNIETRRWEEPCQGIPVIPFFTNISIVITLLLLLIYYKKSKKT